MYITAYFASAGVPATGLSPTVNVRDLSDNSLAVNGAAMTEVGDGFYKYDFTGFNAAKDYVIRCDGGSGLAATDRYATGSTQAEGDISALGTNLATVDGIVDAIKAKTDNLPTDPADQSAVEAAITAATSPLATAADLATVDGIADAIKAKTDNLPSDPADQSAIEAAITAATSPLATAADLATVDGLVDAIKAVIDAWNAEVTDATSLTAGSLMDRLRTLGWLVRNKMIVINATGDVTIYKDDGTTPAFTVSAAITNANGATTRKRMTA